MPVCLYELVCDYKESSINPMHCYLSYKLNVQKNKYKGVALLII
jgi:hypothetical protein